MKFKSCKISVWKFCIHMVYTCIQYIILSIIFRIAEGEINANFHRVNASGTGEQEDHTITANMNNFRVKVDNDNGDIVVASVTDPTERSEVSKTSHIPVAIVPYFINAVSLYYGTIYDDSLDK